MRLRILQAAIVCISIATANLAQQPPKLKLERDDFLKEALTGSPLQRTLYYDASLAGSYHIAKTDVVRGVSEVAKAQGLDLRGLLAIGPYGPAQAFFGYTFVAEKGSIRVNQLTMAQARFTYKSTGTMTLLQYQKFWDGLLQARVLVPGMPGHDAASEARYEILLVRWSGGRLVSYYGSTISPRPGAKTNEFGKLISDLLRSLTKTYPLLHGPSQALPPRPKNDKP